MYGNPLGVGVLCETLSRYSRYRTRPKIFMAENLFEYYQELQNDRLSFIYNGEVSDDATDGIDA